MRERALLVVLFASAPNCLLIVPFRVNAGLVLLRVSADSHPKRSSLSAPCPAPSQCTRTYKGCQCGCDMLLYTLLVHIAHTCDMRVDLLWKLA